MDRVNSIKAQVSSFNDELKDTLKAVELAHLKREELLKEIEGLENSKNQIEVETKERTRKVSDLKIEESKVVNDLDLKERDVTARTLLLEQLQRDINGLFEKETSARTKYDLAKTELDIIETDVKEKNTELDKVSKKLNKTEKQLEATQKSLSDTKLEEQKAKTAILNSFDELEAEKNKHYHRVGEFENKKLREETDFKKRVDEFNKFTGRDIKVVVKRLEREWKKLYKTPFPKIKWVQ